MLIIYRPSNCKPYEANPEVLQNLFDQLSANGLSNFNRMCKESILEEIIDKAAKIIDEIEDVSTARIEVSDAVEAILLRGVLRMAGIHARVKLSEDRTTREHLNAVRRKFNDLVDIANCD
jgi:hypothetical protein